MSTPRKAAAMIFMLTIILPLWNSMFFVDFSPFLWFIWHYYALSSTQTITGFDHKLITFINQISNYSITFAVGLLIKQNFYIMQFDCAFCLYLQINEILWLTKYDLNFRLEYFLIQVYISDFEVKVCLSDPISYYVR